MSEIYWITVIGKANSVLEAIAIIAGCTFVVLMICSSCIKLFSECEDDANLAKRLGITSIAFGVIALITSLLFVFVPSKQDAYLIYGAGTIIDYCQDTPQVKELPDKAVDALNTWLDMVNEEKEK